MFRSCLRSLLPWSLAMVLALASTTAGFAHEPAYTEDFGRDRCTFTTVGDNRYQPIWPGLSLVLEGEEEDDDGELVAIQSVVTILDDIEIVDGVATRVLEEVEREDGELVEISRNFVAHCRETGDVWYFGEDVDDYEDGEIVGHDGAWRAGVDGAVAGILMPGSPMIGARYFQEIAPGVAEDQGEIVALGGELTVPAGTFGDVLETRDTDRLDPDSVNQKFYAPGLGNIRDEALELVAVALPSCRADAATHCLGGGRFAVEVAWATTDDQGVGTAILPTGLSGEFWFFDPENTELIVKVLDACGNPTFDSFWVFAAGLTNVEVALTVTDTWTGETNVYTNPRGADFAPILDTRAFATCDASP